MAFHFETHWAHERAQDCGFGSTEDSRRYTLWWCSVACPQATGAALRGHFVHRYFAPLGPLTGLGRAERKSVHEMFEVKNEMEPLPKLRIVFWF